MSSYGATDNCNAYKNAVIVVRAVPPQGSDRDAVMTVMLADESKRIGLCYGAKFDHSGFPFIKRMV